MKSGRFAVLAASMLLSVGAVNAQAPTPAPPTTGPGAAPSTAPAGRQTQDILSDLQATAGQLQQLLGASPEASMTDQAKRDELAPKVLPLLKKMSGFADELSASQPMFAEQGKRMKMQLAVPRAIFGDAEARAMLDQSAKSADKAEAITAQTSLLMADWMMSNKNVDSQSKMLDQADAMAKANPQSDEVTALLFGMSKSSPANDTIAKRAKDSALAMNTPFAKQFKQMEDSEAKLKSVENKPLTITGTTVDGKPFSTDPWKGKVVLVDFWATWCGPCLQELPKVKDIYQKYHEKGLEIVGVSNDYKGDDLKQFMTKNPDMPWPQLFDPKAAESQSWNPITTGFGIDGIPTMFLIDKKGVCRTVEARENMEELIPKLLAE